jgi:hypothetical protein
MSFEIIPNKQTLSIKIFNEKGDYIDVDFPNKNGFRMMVKFLEETES